MIDINIYSYGSRVYGTHTENSDFDYIVVSDTQIPHQQIDKENTNYTIYSMEEFYKQIREYEISALECLFLPANQIIKNSQPIQPPSDFDLGKLRSSISAKASNSFVKAKKKFIVEKDRNIYVGKKSLFHSLRIPIFGCQLATSGKITNYAAANHYWPDILNNPSENWEDYHKIYKPIHNKEMTEFRKHCPKENT